MNRVKLNFLVMVLSCCLLFSGCIFIVGGAVGALGGYAITQDTIQGDTSKSFSSIWDSSLKVLRIMGTISIEDKQKGVIECRVDSSKVNVSMEEVVSGVIRLRVSSRKYLFPNIKLSQKIYVKIIEHAK